MDFSLAKARTAAAELATLTAPAIILGTPEFMSPQHLRRTPPDPRPAHAEPPPSELPLPAHDKLLAAAIATWMVHVIDSVNQQLTFENRRTVLDLYRQRYQFLSTTFGRSRRELYGARKRYGVFGLEMHLVAMHKTIDQFDPQVVVVDPISSLMGAGDHRDLRSRLRRLFDAPQGRAPAALLDCLPPGPSLLRPPHLGWCPVPAPLGACRDY